LKNILDIANSIKYSGPMLNERYLHHYFSHKLQDKHKILNLTNNKTEITLHPEWPTYKKATCLNYGRYKKVNKKTYQPNKNGIAGFVDFAIGDYNKPHIGIEFSLKYGWSNEEIIFDLLKLMDRKNPFKMVISFNVIFREMNLVKGGYLKDLKEHMNKAVKEAIRRLKNDTCDNSRELYFIVTEIDKNNNKRPWYYNRKNGRFEEGLPKLLITTH